MENLEQFLRVASYQGPILEKEPQANLKKTVEVMKLANDSMVDILCMPESYLHGYFNNVDEAREYAINLQSEEFANLCDQFKTFSPTLILGLNEIDGDHIFSTAVVIEQGNLIGKYRKAYTYPPYDYFSLGTTFPIFEKKGVKYGIIICLDAAYREPAMITALKGARVLFCPMFNRVNKDSIMRNYLHRESHFITRAFDNHCWLVTSDVVWGNERDIEICQGYSAVIDSNGQIVARAQPFHEMLLTNDIPLKKLYSFKKNRLYGNPSLFKILANEYENAVKLHETIL